MLASGIYPCAPVNTKARVLNVIAALPFFALLPDLRPDSLFQVSRGLESFAGFDGCYRRGSRMKIVNSGSRINIDELLVVL